MSEHKPELSEPDLRGNCCQCDNALCHGGHAQCQIAARKALERLSAENREIKLLLRGIFHDKAIEWDANGWAEITMHGDEVDAIQEAIRVH